MSTGHEKRRAHAGAAHLGCATSVQGLLSMALIRSWRQGLPHLSDGIASAQPLGEAKVRCSTLSLQAPEPPFHVSIFSF